MVDDEWVDFSDVVDRLLVESANESDLVAPEMLSLSESLTWDECSDTTLMPMLAVVCDGWDIYVSC